MVASIQIGKGKADIYSGADAAVVRAICQVQKSCWVASPEQTRYNCLRLYGSAKRDRWVGGYGAAAVSVGPIHQHAVSVLRQTARPYQGALLRGLYKRLEQGSYQWPRTENEARQLTPQQYRWLMEGLKAEQLKARRPVDGLRII